VRLRGSTIRPSTVELCVVVVVGKVLDERTCIGGATDGAEEFV